MAAPRYPTGGSPGEPRRLEILENMASDDYDDAIYLLRLRIQHINDEITDLTNEIAYWDEARGGWLSHGEDQERRAMQNTLDALKEELRLAEAELAEESLQRGRIVQQYQNEREGWRTARLAMAFPNQNFASPLPSLPKEIRDHIGSFLYD